MRSLPDISGSPAGIVPRASSANPSESNLGDLGSIVPNTAPDSQALDLSTDAQRGRIFEETSEASTSNKPAEHTPLDPDRPLSQNLPQSSHSLPQYAEDSPIPKSPTNTKSVENRISSRSSDHIARSSQLPISTSPYAALSLRSQSSIAGATSIQFSTKDEDEGSGAQPPGTSEAHPPVDDRRRSVTQPGSSMNNMGSSLDSASDTSGFHGIDMESDNESQPSRRSIERLPVAGAQPAENPPTSGICRAILLETNTLNQQHAAPNQLEGLEPQQKYYRFETPDYESKWRDLLQDLRGVEAGTCECSLLSVTIAEDSYSTAV